MENEVIQKDCPCKKKKCPRHGRCEECRAHHAASTRRRPVYCERPKKPLALSKALAAIDLAK